MVLDFVGWLRERNDRLGDDQLAKTGFYGLDLYSPYRSKQAVISYLERVDPAAAARARERYSCFDHFTVDGGIEDDNAQVYGFAAAFGAGETCEAQVVEQLVELQRNAVVNAQRARRTSEGAAGWFADEELFYAELNAQVGKDAELYYRAMFTQGVSAWNLRDEHMVDTLDALTEHLDRQRGEPPKIVVWAHNSQVGDARATEVALRGDATVGQIVRERRPDDCRLVGFTTYTGTVTAADNWGGPVRRKPIRPALPHSVEELFHEAGEKEFMLTFTAPSLATRALRVTHLERAIGVTYRPQTERQSHYLRARMADQFDAVIHIDETRAVEPL